MPKSSTEDKRLERLYDYTKFHIGIYLSAAGGIAALLGSEKTGWFIAGLVSQNKYTLYAALVFMILAGMCGGVVASSTAEHETFDELWNGSQAPASFRLVWRKLPEWATNRLVKALPGGIPGRTWAAFEHFFFWVSLVLLAYSVAYGFSRGAAAKEPPISAGTPPCCCVVASSASQCPSR